MKDSGIEWIGEIPEDWETIKMRNIGVFSASGIDKLINPGEPLVRIINYTDVYGNKTLLLDDKDYMVVSANEDKIKNHVVEEGDLIFTPSSETIEDIGISALVNKSLPNTAFSYHVLRFQFNRDVFKSYKKYLCNNHYVQNVFSSRATGSIRKTLNRADFKDLIVILPPVEEQQKIANFLDQKVAEIDHILDKTKESIEEYKKYKQSIITEVVTKGLNPDVEMKDSGIEWIGEIPREWGLVKLKNIIKLTDGTHDTPKYVEISENSYPLITSRCIINGVIDFDLANHISSEDYVQINKRSKVELYDVIMPMIGTVGNPAIVDKDVKFSIKNVALFKMNGNIFLSKYLYYLINSNIIQVQFSSVNKGGVQNFVSQEVIRNLLFPFSQCDYKEIVDYLEVKCTEIDSLIAQKEQLLLDLESYKKSLIYECVTGKRQIS